MIAPPHVHRRPERLRSKAWRIIRTILAALGALFIIFIILGVTLGGSTPDKSKPEPQVTVTRTVPGSAVTVTPLPRPVKVTVQPTRVTVNIPPD